MRRGHMPKLVLEYRSLTHATCDLGPTKLVSRRGRENRTSHATATVSDDSTLGNGQRFSFDGHKLFHATRQKGHSHSHNSCPLDCDHSTNNLFSSKKSNCHAGSVQRAVRFHTPIPPFVSLEKMSLSTTISVRIETSHAERRSFLPNRRSSLVPPTPPHARRATPGRHAAAHAPHAAPNANTRTHGRIIP